MISLIKMWWLKRKLQQAKQEEEAALDKWALTDINRLYSAEMDDDVETQREMEDALNDADTALLKARSRTAEIKNQILRTK